MIRIKCEGVESYGAQISAADGTLIHGVTALNIRIEPNDIVRAEMEINVRAVDVVAHPLLGLETIKAAAAVHGYELTPVKG